MGQRDLDIQLLRRSLNLADKSGRNGGDPFGAVLARDGKIVCESIDESVQLSDPTYHAELAVISKYCRRERLFDLTGYTLYTSVEPCVLCSGAIHWARVSRVVFSVSHTELKRFTAGGSLLSCHTLVNQGMKNIQVVGPLLQDEGSAIFRKYPLLSKLERHARVNQV